MANHFRSAPIAASEREESRGLLMQFPTVYAISAYPPIFRLSSNKSVVVLLSKRVRTFFEV